MRFGLRSPLTQIAGDTEAVFWQRDTMAMPDDEIRGDYHDLIDYRPGHSPTHSSGDHLWIIVQVRGTETTGRGQQWLQQNVSGLVVIMLIQHGSLLVFME